MGEPRSFTSLASQPSPDGVPAEMATLSEPQACRKIKSAEAGAGGLVLRLGRGAQQVLCALRDLLRGFCAGPPPDDWRPRGGCC